MARDYDPDGLDNLLAAVALQWLRDAPHETPQVAAWLGVDPDVLRRGLRIAEGPVNTRACQNCGAPLSGGPRQMYCSHACNQAAYMRRKDGGRMADYDFGQAAASVEAARTAYETAQAKIGANEDLSPEGKAKELAGAEAVWRATTRRTIDETTAALSRHKADLQQGRQEYRARLAAQQRQTLGPQFVADVLRRDVASMEPRQILAAVADAADDWERQALLALGRSELAARVRAGKIEVESELADLVKMGQDPDLARLEAGIAMLDRRAEDLRTWDPDYKRELEQRFNIK